MEMASCATLLAMVSIAAGVVAVVFAVRRKLNVVHPNAFFRMYLIGSCMLGMAMVWNGVAPGCDCLDTTSSLGALFWVPLSIFITFAAPLRWSVFPVFYIVCNFVYIFGRAMVGMEEGIGAPCPFLDQAFGCATIFGAMAAVAAFHFNRRRIKIGAAPVKAIGDSRHLI